MYVCMCKQVTDHQLRDAVARGAFGWQEVSRATGCATQCGKCRCLAREIVDEALLARAGATSLLARRPETLAYAAR